MPDEGDRPPRAVDLTGGEYVVIQPAVGNGHRVEDPDGNLVLEGTQERLVMGEETTFDDPDGRPALTVRAGAVLDIAGHYTVIDEGTEEPIVLLDPRFSMVTERWVLRDPETEDVIATIENWSKAVSFLRHLPFLGVAFRILPHGLEIADADGLHVGTIERTLGLTTRYVVRIDDGLAVPHEAIVAATTVIHALAGT